MSFRNTSRFSNRMDPDNAQHFSLNLASAVDTVYQRNILSRQISDALVYPWFTISRQLSNLLELSSLTLYLLVLSADNLGKQFRPRSDPTGMILIQTAWHSTDITENKNRKKTKKKLILKKNISRRQNQGKLPGRQKELMNWNGRCYMYMQVSFLSLIIAFFQYGTV